MNDRMKRILVLLAGAAALGGCNYSSTPEAPANQAAASPATTPGAATALKLSRLDCGTATIKDFDAFFSDKPGLYPKGPREIVDSCYLIQHGDQVLLWDTGFGAALKGSEKDMGGLVARLDKTLAEQLAAGKLTPADVDVVGISHHHADHTGGANTFPAARLLIGRQDYDLAKAAPPQGGPSPIAPWIDGKGKAITFVVAGQHDVFGDGRVMAVHLPGHTPDHLALLVRLTSGPVLLTGDLYHSTDARAKRGVPPFNTSRPETLASMDKFEALAKQLEAKVVIQHEPADVKPIPAYPAAAE